MAEPSAPANDTSAPASARKAPLTPPPSSSSSLLDRVQAVQDQLAPTFQALVGRAVGSIGAPPGVVRSLRASEAQQRALAQRIGDTKAPEPPPEYAPPPPAPTPPSPQGFPIAMKEFGSLAGLIAVFGSLATRAPLTSALNAGAAAIEAQKNNDQTAYKQAMDAWRANADYIAKRNQWQMQRYSAALQAHRDNIGAAEAELRAMAAADGNEVMLARLNQSGISGAVSALSQFAAMNDRTIQTIASVDRAQAMIDWYSGGRGATSLNAMRARAADLRTRAASLPDSDPRKASMLTEADTMDAAVKKEQTAADTPVERTADQRQAAAAMVAEGQPISQVVPGWGRSATTLRQQTQDDAIALLQRQNPGMSAADAGRLLAFRTVSFGGAKSSANQLVKMRSATQQSVEQLDYNIGQVRSELRDLPSSDLSPILNAIARGAENWTGDPAYSKLFFNLQAAMMESGRILSGGQASVGQLHAGAMTEAQRMLNMNMTPSQINAVLDQMQAEGQARIKTFGDAMDYLQQSQGGGAGAPAGSAPTGYGPSAPEPNFTAGETYVSPQGEQWRYKGGDPHQSASWERVR